ncbi:MAG: hypothetical protein ABEJ22_02275 [Haloferacaceae archaeon]
MPARTAELVSFLDRRAGDGLRVVAEYDDSGFSLVYVRDDIEREEVSAVAEEVYRNLWHSGGEHSLVDDRLGRLTASVQLRERAVTIALRREDGGVFVSMERSVARNLDLFTQQCLEVLYGTRSPRSD